MFRLPLLVALGLALAGPAFADTKDQKAADLHVEARALIEKKKYEEAIKKLNEALQRSDEPNAGQGKETRYLERRYDPYYWLGVAHMELGHDEKALLFLEQSEKLNKYIKAWTPEWPDLVRRKKLLEAKLEAALPVVPTKTPVAVAAAPTATPVVVAAAPTATPLVIRIPTQAPPTAVAARPTPKPTTPAEEMRLHLAKAIEALSLGDFAKASNEITLARQPDPNAPQPDVLLTALYASKYLLDEPKSPTTLELAKKSLAEWRRKTGGKRPLPRFLSPAVRKVLGEDGATSPSPPGGTATRAP